MVVACGHSKADQSLVFLLSWHSSGFNNQYVLIKYQLLIIAIMICNWLYDKREQAKLRICNLQILL